MCIVFFFLEKIEHLHGKEDSYFQTAEGAKTIKNPVSFDMVHSYTQFKPPTIFHVFCPFIV